MLMPRKLDVHEKLDALKNDILSLRSEAGKKAKYLAGLDDLGNVKAGSTLEQVEHQISELNRMVKEMLDEAESTASQHPVATVAGALALGIVIGRVSSR
jgi:ElaB/YqjD/DUF883 family membrane-anchored ribosome-binding protein